ncbi:RNA polymerase alpha subunit C-terminal domain-containing protein [Pseudopedobacter sp.]|uniref:RNA polymerase alpha subunit C-terminal domain-containing protein n=1 Tax=Pseudopedobacter sp. TaxID=1936787 RepID=UPI00334283F3
MKSLRICNHGHRYYKSSDCPVCPICEAEIKPADGFLATLSAPARRALEHEQITNEEKLAQYTEKQILQLHGMGKASLPKLRQLLDAKGLSFKKI